MMKRIFSLFALSLLYSFALQGGECCVEECCPCNNTRIYLGPQISYARLDVENTDSTLAGLLGLSNTDTHVDGALYGVNGGIEYIQPWGLFANLDLNYNQGKLKNDDYLSRYIHDYEATGVLGYYMGGGPGEPWSFTVYAGLGYLTQEQSITDYDVKYRYYIYQVPVGIKFDYAFCACCSDWIIGINVAALPQVDSSVKISILKGARWTLSKQTDWVVSLPIEWYSKVCPLSVKLESFWKRLEIGASKAVTPSGLELGLPKQDLQAYGASLDLCWEF